MGEMSIIVGPMSRKIITEICPPGTEINMGDTRIMWDSANADQTEVAKSTFDKLIGKGYRAFKAVGEKGEKGDRLTSFDPKVERMILVPVIAGGTR